MKLQLPFFYIDVTLNIMDLKRRNAYGLMVPVSKKRREG